MIYSLTEVSPMGEADPEYGTRYWCKALEGHLPLMFSKKQEVKAGMKIFAESAEPKTSKKGTDYLYLKGVKVDAGAQSNGNLPSQEITTAPNETKSPSASAFTEADRDMLKDIHRLLRKLALEEEPDKPEWA